MSNGSGARGLQLGFVEPHLRRFGGIRRMVEFANRLVARGHDVTFYLPDDQVAAGCTWMSCDAHIKPIRAGFDDALDIVLWNHEPQWHLIDRFKRARRRVFYVLHYGALYEKEGSWESIRYPVDLQLANSNWTADQFFAETGHRPAVQLGGVNRDVFHPFPGPKKYRVLCSGDDRRAWKGTDTIDAAGQMLGIPVEGYSEKDLEQPALGREYASAEVFVVGSWFEGFCQPGLEALACGTPLVTTDNGGCREYAIDGETALVVPPRDPAAMAAAIRRLLDDPGYAARLASNGLELVARDFDWEKRTDEFAEVLDGVAAGTALAPNPRYEHAVPDKPKLSVVTLAWDNIFYTQKFVESVRRHTDVPYELIVVDNGSEWETADYVQLAADEAIRNDENLGFSRGMNQALAKARGEYVAFCNNDTVLPKKWASRLLESFEASPRAGIAVPALTAARNEMTVRTTPGDKVVALPPFCAPPAAVIYVLKRDVVERIGGWGEEYEIASGEDVDLCFKIWTNELDVVFDERVLVAHIGKGSASRLDDWQGLWARNRRRFLEKWIGDDDVPRLDECDPQRFARNREIARAVAQWMQKYFAARDRPLPRFRFAVITPGGRTHTRLVQWGTSGWKRVRPHLPPAVAQRVRTAGKKLASR